MVSTIDIELLGEVPVYIGVGIQILSAIVFGGMVGYDREKKMKAAGLKTNILICLGATLYTVISVLHLKGYAGGPVDPNRVGAQIVSGIGFLGAGAIIQGRGAVVGMTTAATIWVVAAIGYTIGLGYPVSAGLFSITVLFVLKWINPFYRFLENEEGDDYFHIEVLSLGSVKRSILELIKLEKFEFDEAFEDVIDKKRSVYTLYLFGHPRAIDRLITDIKKLASVEKVSCHQLERDQKYSKDSKVVEFLNNKSGNDSQYFSSHALSMKFLILLLLSISTQAQLDSNLLHGLSLDQQSLFKERLEDFGLLASERVPNPRRRRRSSSEDTLKVLAGLQGYLEGDYLREAQVVLGACQGSDCLGQERGSRRFEESSGAKHCYPYTNCEYYRCMEEKYQCMNVGIEYFQNLAKPTCESYVANIKKGIFSSIGEEWIYTVMVCLQKGLFEECSLRGNCPTSESNEKTCQHITEFTLEFHPGCYINSGVGICKLSLKDQINIWRTVGPFLTEREKIEALKVVKYCLFGTPIE